MKPVRPRPFVPRGRDQPQTKKASNPPSFYATSYPRPPPSPPPSPPPYRMPGKSFECSCNNFALAVKGGGEVSKESFLPNLIMPSRLSLTERLQLEGKLKQESDEMIFRFGGFVNRILRSFKSRSISVSVLIKCLSNFGALPTDRVQTPLLRHRLEQLKSASTTDEVFLVISDYVSFFNHALLEHLVKELGSEDDQEELDTFLVYFEIFTKRHIFETPTYMYGYVWLKTEMLVVLKTEDKWVPGDSCSIKELHDFLGKVCEIMGVLPHALHVCRVDRGSLELVCRMPPHVVDEVFPLSKGQERDLGEAGLTQLHCVEYCFRKTGESQLECSFGV